MRKYLAPFLLSLFLAIPACAMLSEITPVKEPVAYVATFPSGDNKEVVVILRKNKCSPDSMQDIVAMQFGTQALPNFAESIVWYEGKAYKSCYRVIEHQGELVAILIDEEHDGGVIPLKLFKPVSKEPSLK